MCYTLSRNLHFPRSYSVHVHEQGIIFSERKTVGSQPLFTGRPPWPSERSIIVGDTGFLRIDLYCKISMVFTITRHILTRRLVGISKWSELCHCLVLTASIALSIFCGPFIISGWVMYFCLATLSTISEPVKILPVYFSLQTHQLSEIKWWYWGSIWRMLSSNSLMEQLAISAK